MASSKSISAAECPVCFNIYTDPRFLPACGHSFCLKCIKQSAKVKSLEVECPLCRKLSVVTDEGFEGLTVNFTLISLIETLISDKNVRVLSDDIKNIPLNFCTKHKDEELVLVCVDCWTPVCVECQKETHNKHQMSSVRKFVADTVRSLKKDVNETNLKLSQIKNKKDELKVDKDQLLRQITEQEAAINKEYESVKLLLDQERSKLMEKLISIKQFVLKCIEHNNQEFDIQDQELRSLNIKIQEMSEAVVAEANFDTINQLKEIKERLDNAINVKIELRDTKSDFKFIPTDLQSIIKKSSVHETAGIIGNFQIKCISNADKLEIFQNESTSGALLSKLKQTENISVDSKFIHEKNEDEKQSGFDVSQLTHEIDKLQKRNRQIVQNLTPQTSETSNARFAVIRSFSQKFPIDEHLWHYLLFKHADKVAAISSENLCEAKVVSVLSKGVTSYFLEVSPYVYDANDVKNSIENAVEEFAQLFQKISNPPIMEDNIKLPPELDKTETENLKTTLSRMGYLLMPSDPYRLIGPVSHFEEAKGKVCEVIYEHQSKTLSAVNDEDETLKFKTPSGLKVFVSQGNLVEQTVDAIVNPANFDLRHGGGAGRAISKAAGPALDRESREYIRKNGSLRTTWVTHTTAGNLRPKIKYVIHAVGPMKSDYRNDEDLFQDLKRTVYNCLHYANSHLKIQSTAIPAISSGIFGVPLRIVAEASFAALVDFDKTLSQGSRVLNEIHFLNKDQPTVSGMRTAFAASLKRTFGSNVDSGGKNNV